MQTEVSELRAQEGKVVGPSSTPSIPALLSPLLVLELLTRPAALRS